MDRGTEELLELIRLTERISADIHGLRDKADVLQTVVDTFRNASGHFQTHIFLLDDEIGKLRVAATSFRQRLVRLGETIAGVSMKTFHVDPDTSPLLARVLREGVTVRVPTTQSLADLIPSRTAKNVLRAMHYGSTEDILTPLHVRGRPLGILSVTAPGLAEHFIPSLKALARHIGSAFELVDAIREVDSARTRYRDLVENLNEIIYTVDLTGIITYISPNVSWFGFTPDELLGTSFVHVFEGEDAEAAQAQFDQFIAGDESSSMSEFRLRGKDGTVYWIKFSSRIALEDGHPTGVHGSMLDVTQEKDAEAALRESKRILNQMGHMARIGGWEHDMQTGEAIWTRELYGISGIDPGDKPPGVSEHLNYYPPVERARLERAYNRAVETGEPFDLELQGYTSVGELRWFRAYGEAVFEDGRCIRMRGTFQDIDDVKRVQLAHAESERRLETLMGNLPGMAYRCQNEPDWTMVFVSNGCFELTGYRPTDLIDNRTASFGSLIMPEDRQTVWEAVQQALAERRPFSREYRILTADGAQKWVWEQGQGVFLDGGELVVLEGFISDVTSRKTAEQTLSDHQKRLKLALDGTIAVVARIVELRDPYTAGHQERVSLLACAIAREMGHLESLGQALRVAGLLHDVGKIAVPSEILSKPTRLTDTEIKLVRSHAEAGYQILKDIIFPWPIADIVRQHHERLDGSGYPQGLRGKDICLGGRVLAIADVVEAIATHRPYRPALGIEFALEEVERGRGTLFDTDAVNACLRLFRKHGLTLETLSEDVCIPEAK